MGSSNRAGIQRAKNAAMAADLVKRGIYHGKRITKPSANSGGMTLSFEAGSSRYQRLQKFGDRKRLPAYSASRLTIPKIGPETHYHELPDGTCDIVEIREDGTSYSYNVKHREF